MLLFCALLSWSYSPRFLSGTQFGRWFCSSSLEASVLFLQWFEKLHQSRWSQPNRTLHFLQYLRLMILSPNSTANTATITEIKPNFPILKSQLLTRRALWDNCGACNNKRRWCCVQICRRYRNSSLLTVPVYFIDKISQSVLTRITTTLFVIQFSLGLDWIVPVKPNNWTNHCRFQHILHAPRGSLLSRG